MRSQHRSPDDDFFCEKYQVWYPTDDCNYRVLQKTYEGCVQCFQGRVNLRRLRAHEAASAAATPGNVLFFPARARESVAGAPARRNTRS